MNLTNLKVTFILISLNFVIFAFENLFLGDESEFALYFGLNSYFFDGFYWQIFTTMFLHGSLMHVLMNMAVLFQFGSLLERRLGGAMFALLYLGGGTISGILSLTYLHFDDEVNLVGASGAICVLLGFWAYLDRQNAAWLFFALLLMSFAPMLLGLNVAWYAHIFGFFVGFGAARLRRTF